MSYYDFQIKQINDEIDAAYLKRSNLQWMMGRTGDVAKRIKLKTEINQLTDWIGFCRDEVNEFENERDSRPAWTAIPGHDYND